jgi:hypothetical protein
MTRSDKWKNALLMSSMPLEFEAARLLAQEGFAINSDFRYGFHEGETRREKAIDLHARLRMEMTGGGETGVPLELLVDCVHRPPNAAGLFLPDLNPEGLSPASPGRTLRMVDQFSPFVISPDAAVGFDQNLPLCYKGMEVNLETGEVDEGLFRQGMWRLQNPLPRLLSENIQIQLTALRHENRPFLFCPVLLTTSELYVLRPDITLEGIAAAEDVRDVGTRTPYLVIYSDMSPDFRRRCVTEFDRLRPLLRDEKAEEIERKKARFYGDRINLPFTILDALMAADYFYLNAFFTQFVVCSNDAFPALVRLLKKTAVRALETCDPIR